MKKISYIVSLLAISSVIFFVYLPATSHSLVSASYGLAGGPLRLFHTAGDGIRKSFKVFFDIGSLRKENLELSNKIMSLEVDRSKIEELQVENNILKKELGFVSTEDQGSLIPARILQRDPVTFFDSIVVDKGEKDGVALNMSVVSDGVLVGKVSDVFANSSKIVLITSKDSIVQAMLQDTRAKGILRGGIAGLSLENIVSDNQYKEGEYVITSGLGDTMKPGILIGKAGKIQSSSSEIFESIAVEPMIDLSKLEIVFIQK